MKKIGSLADFYRKNFYRKKLVIDACCQFATCDWHWFQYHFSFIPLHPFAASMLEAIVECDDQIENFGKDFLQAVIAISGKEKDLDHFDQLLQRMAELLVIRQCLRIDVANPIYRIEPTAGKGKKRPDLVIDSDLIKLVVEIKAPSMSKLSSLRAADSVQVLNRLPTNVGNMKELFSSPIILPRDNAVKDFLISANEKFASFKSEGDCLTLLVIVWDDFIQEVITALAHEQSGLLTLNSFAKDGSGAALAFPHVDGVLIVRHLTYFARATAGHDIEDRKHAFDFGNLNSLPNVFLPNPAGRSSKEVPENILDVLRAIQLGDERIAMAAEYRPKELIFWI